MLSIERSFFIISIEEYEQIKKQLDFYEQYITSYYMSLLIQVLYSKILLEKNKNYIGLRL